MTRLFGRILAALVFAATFVDDTSAASEKRVALVIGNSAYTEAGRLVNAPNDAREIAAALTRLDFDVTSSSDLTNAAFGMVVKDFVTKARGADVALFFYAGHALQVGSTNYLMPIDARLDDELAVKRETIAAQDIVDLMEGAAKINLVFLDACRNNPLTERLRAMFASTGRGAAVGRGLGRIDAKGRDTLIVFSAEPGAEALDTTGGGHSPFAAGLLENIETPGLEIEVMLKHVTKSVRSATQGKQQPERLSRLESVFYLKPADLPENDTALRRLVKQIGELTTLLSLEKAKSKEAEEKLERLEARQSALKDEPAGDGSAIGSEARISALMTEFNSQKQISNEALAKVDLLNQQLLSLRRQIAALNEALEASEKKDKDSQDRIKDLGFRLNAALARQVQELQRYRSDFFGRSRDLLKDRKDIRVIGDRLVLESEVLFASGDASLTGEGRTAIDKLAVAIIELSKSVPPETDWVMQVDGHTDARPVASAKFPSNWELSTARASSVVKHMIQRGVPPNRLVAAGYGEFRPLESGNDELSQQKNRRIELKLTNQ